MKEINSLRPELQELVDLGIRLGQNFAYGTVGGRCAAAQAAALRKMRETKVYRHYTPQWGTFCSKILKISKTQADLMIRLLDELGPAYFEVAQLTRISPDFYRIIKPYIRDGVLHYNGEIIELTEANAEKVADTVGQMRASLPKPPDPPPPSIPERLEALERRWQNLVEELRSIAGKERSGEHWQLTLATLEKCRSAIGVLDLEREVEAVL